MMNFEFYKEKNVLVTGHTGFKGAYLCKMLTMHGAHVTGYALEAEEESVFNILKLEDEMVSVIGDIRDFEKLADAYKKAQPEIVFHLAAQPIVRESYRDPLYTYSTNVMGTANLLECVRLFGAKSVVNVTTDKVYKNREWEWGYRENEELDGFDPYSNSKSCSELVTKSYKRSFLDKMNIPTTTMRAGNVIGGGDFAKERIIPDCVRGAREGKAVELRSPDATRPFQHVFEPVTAYMYVAMAQYDDFSVSGSYNVGPDEIDCVTTLDITKMFCEAWGEGASYSVNCSDALHEANFLKLDTSKLKRTFGIKNVWNIRDAVEKTVEWTKAYFNDEDIVKVTEREINEFLSKRN